MTHRRYRQGEEPPATQARQEPLIELSATVTHRAEKLMAHAIDVTTRALCDRARQRLGRAASNDSVCLQVDWIDLERGLRVVVRAYADRAPTRP